MVATSSKRGCTDERMFDHPSLLAVEPAPLSKQNLRELVGDQIYQMVYFSESKQNHVGTVTYFLMYLVVMILVCIVGPVRRLYSFVFLGSWYIRARPKFVVV